MIRISGVKQLTYGLVIPSNMNKALAKLFVDRLTTGLKRTSISTCSQWAVMYRVMGQPFAGPFSFTHHPWSKEIHDATNELIVGMKAAQMGFTEVGLNKAFYTIDIIGSSVLYVLPASTPDASDFSASRFDPALDLSPHLRKIFSDVKNVGHKRAGSASLFIRGSRSRSQMKSVPASLIIFDELDEMNRENVVLARERTSGQNISQEFMLSTPRIENRGIDIFFKQSTQEHFFFKCPHCNRLIQLVYPDSLIITAEDPLDPKIEDSHLICTECKHKLDNDDKPTWLSLDNSQWVPEKTNRAIRGFAVSQLYSMAKASRPAVIAAAALKSKTDPTEEQELYNSKLGLCHTVEGARIVDSDIITATKKYRKYENSSPTIWTTMGVDVGPKWLYVEIDQYFLTRKKMYDSTTSTMCRVINEFKLSQFEELDDVMIKYNIMHCVIDAQPERRKSLEFAQRFYGIVNLCYYGQGQATKTISENREEMSVTVGRTVWLDSSLMRFKRKTIELPMDTSLEYKDCIKAPVRIYEKDKDGNPIGRYDSGDKEDHFAHARNYSEIAFTLCINGSGSQPITEQPS